MKITKSALNVKWKKKSCVTLPIVFSPTITTQTNTSNIAFPWMLWSHCMRKNKIFIFICFTQSARELHPIKSKAQSLIQYCIYQSIFHYWINSISKQISRPVFSLDAHFFFIHIQKILCRFFFTYFRFFKAQFGWLYPADGTGNRK